MPIEPTTPDGKLRNLTPEEVQALRLQQANQPRQRQEGEAFSLEHLDKVLEPFRRRPTDTPTASEPPAQANWQTANDLRNQLRDIERRRNAEREAIRAKQQAEWDAQQQRKQEAENEANLKRQLAQTELRQALDAYETILAANGNAISALLFEIGKPTLERAALEHLASVVRRTCDQCEHHIVTARDRYAATMPPYSGDMNDWAASNNYMLSVTRAIEVKFTRPTTLIEALGGWATQLGPNHPDTLWRAGIATAVCKQLVGITFTAPPKEPIR